VEFGIVEVAQHRVIGCHVHGIVVIRAQPLLVGVGVAAGTLLAADEIPLGRQGYRSRCFAPRVLRGVNRNNEREQGQDDEAGLLPLTHASVYRFRRSTQRLVEVRDEVVQRLDANGQADQLIRDTAS
jgi:hypothetical protein